MDLLRADLAPLRRRIREAEDQWANGRGDEPARAIKKWRGIAEELKRSYGEEPRVIDFATLLGFGGAAQELLDSPESHTSWLGFLLSLPVDALRRIVRRRSIVELHTLLDERPASRRLSRAVESLFSPRKLMS